MPDKPAGQEDRSGMAPPGRAGPARGVRLAARRWSGTGPEVPGRRQAHRAARRPRRERRRGRARRRRPRKVAFITGAARGQGRAIRLAEEVPREYASALDRLATDGPRHGVHLVVTAEEPDAFPPGAVRIGLDRTFPAWAFTTARCCAGCGTLARVSYACRTRQPGPLHDRGRHGARPDGALRPTAHLERRLIANVVTP